MKNLKEDKELLLKDLCSRLPYGVKVGTADNDGSLENVWDMLWYNTFTEDLKLTHSIEDADKIVDISETKPYLFPLSSMTEEQIEEAKTYFWKDVDYGKSLVDKGINCFYPCFNILEFYHKNHFDYRGLIEKGLAIDCTNLNIY